MKRGSIHETAYERNFEKQVKFFKKHFHFMNASEYFENKVSTGNINFLITFDDSYKDNYDLAFPVLKKYNAKAAFFIVTGLVGTGNWLWHDKVHTLVCQKKISQSKAGKILADMNAGIKVPDDFIQFVNTEFRINEEERMVMNWDELSEMQQAGFEIGSHTDNHAILPFVDDDIQYDEIKLSKQKIENHLKCDCISFAYPNGLYNKVSLKILKNNNIKYGYSTMPGFNDAHGNKLLIKRIGLNASDSIPVILLKLFVNQFK
ncbi:MAG: polysaccharide deacetylase family protein [Chromatiales bacterium]